MDARSLMKSGQTPLVVLALVGVVSLDVPDVMLGESVNGRLDGLHASWLPHGLSGEVGVSSSPVPVALHGLGIKADHDPEVLSDPDEQVPGQPEVIPHVDAEGGPHLELPLGGHHLGVSAADPDPSVQTGAVMSLTWNS